MTTIEDIKQKSIGLINQALHDENLLAKIKTTFESVQDKEHWKNSITPKAHSIEDAPLIHAAIVWYHAGATIEEIDGKIMIGSDSYYTHCGA